MQLFCLYLSEKKIYRRDYERIVSENIMVRRKIEINKKQNSKEDLEGV